ncbi:hypothetical protein MAPG_08110 [Magnaporthiopsis poae ATCC 64411]|uniref:Hemerythrin-like domain-containing protein n=1 Tax=Magnaporthiopsis poae (strain ATCC 64411 / 73-15) TaxID=644358 RepID=A0A0C4E6H2_MAGP6|nr:hypothetical protein MAPG_08110 [Magnaporthiopsis poae ATCC 64411]
MRSAFWQLAIPYSTHPRPYRRLLLLALGIPRPVPRTVAARSIPTPAYTIASRMATQSDMLGVSAPAPVHEAPVGVPAGEASSAAATATGAEQAEAKPVAENTDDGVDDGAAAAAEPALPPLTPAEFREFNRLADQMTFYHNHFKQSWNILHDAASTGRRPKNMTLKQFLDTGLSFVRGLTMHHDIEETYLYPMLAPKMSEFRHSQGGGSGSKKLSQKQSELIQQHRDIHDGMEQFEDYISKCRSREADLEMGVLLEKLDSWGAVLWKHMDQEVETLGAANMRKYYTVNEMRRLRM